MFLKQYNFKPRSGSQSSGTNESAVDTSGTAAAAAESPIAATRRRSSATEKFAALNAHKRTSQDTSIQDKKAAFADQKPGGQGVLGGMWNSFTKGT